jgi:hypothetical protein
MFILRPYLMTHFFKSEWRSFLTNQNVILTLFFFERFQSIKLVIFSREKQDIQLFSNDP